MIGWVVGLAALGLAGWYWRERSFRRTHPMMGGLQADLELPHTAEFELLPQRLLALLEGPVSPEVCSAPKEREWSSRDGSRS